MTRLKKVRQVLLLTLLLNISVAIAKIIYGYITDSVSMISDGYHSLSDGASNTVGLIGIWIASHPPDESHPYGHRKFETLSTIAIAVMIFAAGLEILRETWARLQSPNHMEVTSLSFIVMGTTLLVNIWVMNYETRKGNELKSDFLVADALHTRSDIFISLSVIASLIAAKIGYPELDLIAAVIILVFIVKMGFSILKSAADVLTDTAQINPEEIKKIATTIDGVMDCHGIRTRGIEHSVHIDLHLLLNPDMKLRAAHDIAHHVEEAIKKKFPAIVDAVIHIEPYRKDWDTSKGE